jgi:DNA-binding transcriptional regulator LsrR (DeoR family)
MKGRSEILRLVEISRLYYEEGLTQAEIAKKLDISRPAVSKLLSEARIRGIVKIEIKSPLESNENLLKTLSQQFNLEGGLIVQTGSAEASLKRRLLISQAVQYVEKQIHEAASIGLGWGLDAGSIVDELASKPQSGRSNGTVCPVIGTAPNASKWFQTNELVRIFSNKTGYTPFYLPAPAFPVSIANKRLFEQTNEYRTVSSLWDKLDMVLLGIGTYPSVPDQATAARFGDKLKKEGAVGMMATYYFDRNGNFIESQNDIVIRIPLALLRKTRIVLVIGSGPEKMHAIVGALKTGIVTHLITDEETALQVAEWDL